MSKYIQGQNRAQTYLFPVTLDDAVDAENEVRLIDLFVDGLDFGGVRVYGATYRKRKARLPPSRFVETIYLRLPQPRALLALPRKREQTQYRSDMAAQKPLSRPQHHLQFQARQPQGHQNGVQGNR